MKLGRQVVVGHCQIVWVWNPSVPLPLQPSSAGLCWFLPFIEPLKQNILDNQHKIKILFQTMTDDFLFSKQILAPVSWYQACPKYLCAHGTMQHYSGASGHMWIACRPTISIFVNFVHRGNMKLISHTRTVVRECCKGDDESLWQRGKFDPPPPKNPSTDGHQNLCW